MKSLSYRLILILLFTGTVATAQNMNGLIEHDPMKRATARTEIMKTKLHLSATQYPKVLELNKALALKMQPILFGTSGDREKRRQAMPLLREHRKALLALLTDEQRTLLAALRKEYRPRLRQLMRDYEDQGN